MAGISGSLGSLWVEIGARITKFEAEMANVSKTIDKTISDSEEKFAGFQKLGSQLTGIGVGLTAAVTLPIVAMGTAAIKASGDFDTAMRLVSARGDITGKDLDKLKAQAEDLGAKTQFSSKQAAEGMAELAGAGQNTTQIFQAMPGIMNLAAAAGSSVGDAAKTAKDILGQFGLQAGDTAHVVDVLAKSGNLSSGSLAEMANSLKYVGPPAVAAGLSLEDTAAALLALDKAGIRSEQAGTSFRSMLQSLQGPTQAARDILKEMGVTVVDAGHKMLPLPQIIDNLKAGLATLEGPADRSAALTKIFGENATTAAQAIQRMGSETLVDFRTQLNNVSGEAQRTATVMNSGMGGALERLRGSVETASQKIGDVLAPTVLQIAGQLESAANSVAGFAGWFAKLPQPIQTGTLAIVAFAAALGPMLLIAGQFAGAISSISLALPILSKALALTTTGITSAVGALTAFNIVAAAGVVGLAVLAKGVYDQYKAESAMRDSQAQTGKALKKTEDLLRSQGGAVDALKEKLKAGSITQLQYEQGLQGIAKQIGDAKKATQDHTTAQTTAQKVQTAMEAALKAGTAATKTQADETKKAVIPVLDFSKAGSIQAGVINALVEQYEKSRKSVIDWKVAHQDAASVTPKLTETTKELDAAIQQMVSSAKLVAPAFLDAGKQAVDAMKGAVDPIKKVDDAFKKLGITSQDTLQKQADDAREAYETIARDAPEKIGDIMRAWEVFEEKRKKAAVAAGTEISDADQKSLDKSLDALHDNHDKQKDSWSNLAQQVSTIISDAGKNIIGRFADLGKVNEKLDEDAQKLKDNLAERQKTYEDFAAGIQESLASARDDYADSLAKEEADLEASLADREADYEDFAKEVSEKIDDLRKKHKEEAEKERKAILDGLDDKTQDYNDYQGDIEGKIADIRRTHNDSQKKEEATLAKSLADRTTDYNRFVEDVNVKLARIREKNKGGFSEEEADLLKSLQRRTEDFNTFKTDTATKLAEFTADNLAEQGRQEQDQRDSLARRTRDFKEYQDDVASKLDEVTTKHQQEQAKEEADLQASLDKKGQALDKYEADAVTKFEKIRQAALDKLTKQETDLNDKLAKQATAWETYKEAATKQLQEIEDKHLGVFDKIKTVGIGIFTDLGSAIGRFVTETLVGSLFKQLGHLADDILPGLAGKLKSVFGGLGGAADTAANAATDAAGNAAGATTGATNAAGGAAGAVGSSIAGIVGAVGSIASAVTGVISNFQNARQETTLNAIEHNTKYSMMYLGERSDGGILGVLFRVQENTQYVQGQLDGLNAKLSNWLEPLGSKLVQIQEKLNFAQLRFDQIGSDTVDMRASLQNNQGTLQAMLTELRNISSASRIQPVINVYVDGIKTPARSDSLKMNGILTL